MRIVRAILAGERDPQTLAALSHPGIHASRDTIAKSLEGTWRVDLLFVLQQEVPGTRPAATGHDTTRSKRALRVAGRDWPRGNGNGTSPGILCYGRRLRLRRYGQVNPCLATTSNGLRHEASLQMRLTHEGIVRLLRPCGRPR
jgi:hypothetical protein